MARKIGVIAGFLKERHILKLRALAVQYGYEIEFYPDVPDFQSDISDCEILFGNCFEAVLRKASGVKWIAHSWAGVNTICTPEFFPNPDCLLTNSSVYGVTIAEHLIMLCLMLMRKEQEAAEIIACGEWHNLSGMISSLYGSRITVVGTGDIGTEFAKRARAFSPAIIRGVRRNADRPNPSFDSISSFHELDTILPETDLLILCVPETAETRNLLSIERLSLLPASSFLINVGRGSVLDQDALVDALNCDRLAGAALDVVVPEPLPADSPLRRTKNLLLTPHCAGKMNLDHTIDLAVDRFCENMVRYTAGETLRWLVDRSIGY